MRRDDGSVTLFMVISVVGLLVLVGLIVDGGARVRADQRADAIAAEAARAAGQAIDARTAIPGGPPSVDPVAGRRAASAYLSASGAAGTVVFGDAGRTVNVSVTTSAPTVFLGIIGIDSFTTRGHATATLARGADRAEP